MHCTKIVKKITAMHKNPLACDAPRGSAAPLKALVTGSSYASMAPQVGYRERAVEFVLRSRHWGPVGMSYSSVPRCFASFVASALLVGVLLAAGFVPQAEARPNGWQTSKYAAIVIDANTDQVLFSRSADASRYPASLTKMMTLYMLFGEMRAGRATLSTQMRVSAHAAAQPPTKLDLKAGRTISVRAAILTLVTKSANDVAAVVAEHIGGTESGFAAMMTKKAHALGMTSTTFRNASGLPNSGQRTTARDMARLATALMRDFPEYYDYFKTRSFSYNGRYYRNHNRLLESVKGVDGIKTGYIRASGFNVATSARRGPRHLIAVVMGGPSGGARDNHMSQLLSQLFPKASTTKTVTQYVSLPEVPPLPPTRPGPRQQVASAAQPVAAMTVRPKVLPTAAPAAQSATEDPIEAVLATVPQGDAEDETPQAVATVLPKSTVPLPPSAPITASPEDRPRITASASVTGTIAERLRERWLIQIGAYNGEQAARERLRDAEREAEMLKGRLAYTEPVQKDALTLYRARFAGFDRQDAEAACKKLKRANFPCLPMRQ